MLSTPRLEILNTVIRLASLGVLVVIAVQLGSRRTEREPQPVTVGEVQAARNDPAALKALEKRIPLVRVGGDVNVSGSVDVNSVLAPVSVTAGIDGLPVTVTGISVPVTIANEVRVEVTNHELATEVTNLPGTLPVRVTNFYDMPRR